MRSHKHIVTEKSLRRDSRAVALLAAFLAVASVVVFGQAVATRVAPDLLTAVSMPHVTPVR